MNVTIISVFPELHQSFISSSLIGKAQQKGLVAIDLIKFSDMYPPKVRIDEPTCGPGAGMIIKPECLQKALELAEAKYGHGTKIFFSPQGIKLTQDVLKQCVHNFLPVGDESQKSLHQVKSNHLILICSRYEGIDERVIEHYADLVVSIGDYVLMGGDIPAQVFLEGILRLIPGVVGNQESVAEESFSGPFLDHPQYGLPTVWQDKAIPEIVLSGNHGAIDEWRKESACEKTVLNRYDWFRSHQPSLQDLARAKKYIPRHYVAVMHTKVLVKGDLVGETSIASLDIHDIARSCKTYGIERYFIASALQDQQKILQTFLSFWHSHEGKEYNESRYESVALIKPVDSLEEIIQQITAREGQRPLIIATSAKEYEHAPAIDYYSQSHIWQQKRPILLLFGTGQGLSDILLKECNYMLLPIKGMTSYNHLSVRAAVSIILDRWLGLNQVLKSTLF